MPRRPFTLEAALRYAASGLPVVPIRPGGKAPLIEGAPHAASADVHRIEGWWRRWPRADLALACGKKAGFDALDVDRQHGGIDSLAALIRRHDAELPATSCQRTPSGGFHLLFRHQPGLKNRSGGQGGVPPGLDCRTHGAMIRTAPTPGFRWQLLLPVDDLPAWPSWLTPFYREVEVPPFEHALRAVPGHWDKAAPYLSAALAGLAEEIASAPPGAQNTTLNGASFRAGRLLAALPGGRVDAAVSQLVQAGLAMVNQAGRSPWQRRDIERIVRRAIDDGLRKGPTAAMPAKVPSTGK